MSRRKPRTIETRWLIYKDYYRDNGDHMNDTWCIMYGTQSEAEEMMNKLKAGSDLSFFNPDPNDDEQAILYVNSMEL